MGKFKCTYQVDDGYVGNRPRHFFIELDEEEMAELTDDELTDMFEENMIENFEMNITPYEKNLDEFIKSVRKEHEQNIRRNTISKG